MAILIVDDAGTIRKQLARVLTSFGLTDLIEACDGEGAIQLLTQGGQVDLIFSDWHMPKQSGLELLRWVRSSPTHSGTKFIMLTTEQERTRILEAARLGLQGYLFKPIQAAAIQQKLASLNMLPASVAAAPPPSQEP